MSGVVDRLLAQLPGLQSDSPYARGSGQVVSFGGPVTEAPRRDFLGPWARLLLGLILGTTIAWWPYSRSCGAPLAGYLCALLTIVFAAGVAAVSSWKHRAPLAHVLSLILLFYGIMMTVAELLPRTGYAVDHASWACEEPVTMTSNASASLFP
jgi:hypothetical protein